MPLTSIRKADATEVTLKGTHTTADDTPVTPVSLLLTDPAVYLIEALAVCRDQAGVERGIWGVLGMFHRETGDAALDGSLQNAFIANTTSSGLDATLVVSGDHVLVQVTGLAATTINWATTLWAQKVG